MCPVSFVMGKTNSRKENLVEKDSSAIYVKPDMDKGLCAINVNVGIVISMYV